MDRARQRREERQRRAARVRARIRGMAARPRLCVHRTLRHISGQLVDDTAGRSLVQVVSTSREVSEMVKEKGKAKKVEIARIVGELLAAKAKERGITSVVFDRKGYLYHGRVKALADGARTGGLAF